MNVKTDFDRNDVIRYALTLEPGKTPREFDIDATGHRFDGASDRELACALETISGHGMTHEVAGTVDTGGHYARYGRWIMQTDIQGFVDVLTYDSSEAAQAALDTVRP